MLVGVVLAAGASSRIGRPKALLPASQSGETFLSRIVRTHLEANLERVVVVVGPGAAAILLAIQEAALPVDVIENCDPSRGQLSSLVCAIDVIARHDVDAVLVHPVDQPLVRSDTVLRLAIAYRDHRPAVVRPIRAGRHGHPVIFDRSLFDELRQADPDVGARAVVAAHAQDVLDVPTDDDGAFADIDTPEDYERLVGLRFPGR